MTQRDGVGIAAALAWWREAGLEHDFADAPQQWLAATVPDAAACLAAVPIVAAAAAPRPLFGGDPQGWPQALAHFSTWWLNEPQLDPGQQQGRVPPRGPARAVLMVLVDFPEAGDGERLLSGPQGKLLDAVLAALGLAPDEVYVASALPRQMPMPDWQALAAAGLGPVLAHHVSLVAPQRLLVLSRHVSSLLGHDPANSTGFSSNLHHEGPSMPVLGATGLDNLIARPRGKAGLWQALLGWMETGSS